MPKDGATILAPGCAGRLAGWKSQHAILSNVLLIMMARIVKKFEDVGQPHKDQVPKDHLPDSAVLSE